MKKQLISCLLAAGFLLGAPASAVPVIDSFTGGGGPFDVFYGASTGDAVGFSFRADVDITVSDLGVLDASDGVLDNAHMVGLWDAGGTLLGSTSVDATGTLINGWFYAPLASAINLTAGMDYVLAAVYAANDGDFYWSGPATITTNLISMTAGVFPAVADLGLAFPTEMSQNLGRLGPNMLAEPTATPEPGSLVLIGLGLLGLVRARLR